MELPEIIEDIESLPKAGIVAELEKFDLTFNSRSTSKKLAALYIEEIYDLRNDSAALKKKLKKTTIDTRKSTPQRNKKSGPTVVPDWMKALTIPELRASLIEHGIAGAIHDGNRHVYEKVYVKKLQALPDVAAPEVSKAKKTAAVAKKKAEVEEVEDDEEDTQEAEEETQEVEAEPIEKSKYEKATVFSSDEEAPEAPPPVKQPKKLTKKIPSSKEKPAAPKVTEKKFAEPVFFSEDEDADVKDSVETAPEVVAAPVQQKAKTLDDSGALVCQLVLLSMLTMAIYQLAMGENGWGGYSM